MSVIIPIGGGELSSLETLFIDKYIVSLSPKLKPNVLFIPTASSDSRKYFKKIKMVYGKNLRCNVKPLFLLRRKRPLRHIKASLDWADIIYVGGGNTKKLINVWNNLGVTKEIKNILNTKILCGLSAGANCWYSQCISDYENTQHKPNWKYRLLPCLGFLPGIMNPHNEERIIDPVFIESFKDTNTTYIGLDNLSALSYKNGQINKVINTEGKNVWNVKIQSGQITKKPLIV